MADGPNIADSASSVDTVTVANLSSSTTPAFADSDGNDIAALAAFLVAFLVFGFVTNCVLIATIAQSHRLKGRTLNVLVLSAAVANLLDCVVSIPLVLGDTLTAGWDYGYSACRAGAAVLQLTNAAVTLSIAALVVDRLLALRSADDPQRRLSTTKALVVVFYVWLHSSAVSLPLAVNAVKSSYYPARHMCSVAPATPALFVCIVAVITYLIPATFLVGSCVVIARYTLRSSTMASRAAGPTLPTDTSDLQMTAEISASKYTGALALSWVVLVVPHLTLLTSEQYRNHHWKNGAVFSYPWRLELSFTWLRLGYPLLLPIITFCWRKDIWRRLHSYALCRKSNLINDDTAPPSCHTDVGWHDAAANGGIPVLFATENGLHLQKCSSGRLVSQEDEDGSGDASPMSVPCQELDSSGGSVAGVVTSSKCDVYGSQFLQAQTDGEDATSDYDSDDIVKVLPANHLNTVAQVWCPTETTVLTEPQNSNSSDMQQICREDRTSNGDSGRGSADDATLRNVDTLIDSAVGTSEVGEKPAVISSVVPQRKRKRRRKKQDKEQCVNNSIVKETDELSVKKPPVRLVPIAQKSDCSNAPEQVSARLNNDIVALPLTQASQDTTLTNLVSTEAENGSSHNSDHLSMSANEGSAIRFEENKRNRKKKNDTQETLLKRR